MTAHTFLASSNVFGTIVLSTRIRMIWLFVEWQEAMVGGWPKGHQSIVKADFATGSRASSEPASVIKTCTVAHGQEPAVPHVPKTIAQPTCQASAGDRLWQAAALSRTQAALQGAGLLDAVCRESPLIQQGGLAQELHAEANRPAQAVPAMLRSSSSSFPDGSMSGQPPEKDAGIVVSGVVPV